MSVMKICVKFKRFEFVECFFEWYKELNRELSVVMYIMMIYSRFLEEKYREVMSMVWEMEELNCFFDFFVYRVVIRLFVVLDDLGRVMRYYFKFKEVGFILMYDIFCEVISVCIVFGRLIKCREICKEVEDVGLRLDVDILFRLL